MSRRLRAVTHALRYGEETEGARVGGGVSLLVPSIVS